MTEQLSLDDVVTGRPAGTLARSTDPHTSRVAALGQRRRGSHLLLMLRAYLAHADLTDVEAAGLAGLERVEATRRASELRGADLIEPVIVDGELKTRLLPSGRPGMVCRITDAGREAAA